MNTVELVFDLPLQGHEVLIAELDELGCHGFVQEGTYLRAYFSENQWTQEKKKYVDSWLRANGIKNLWKERLILEKDWNEPWERSIKPVLAGNFLIRPSWCSSDDIDDKDVIHIEIDPKMSFGTGHHETTRLMLRMLPGLVEEGDKVLDAGSGTAILAIAAIKSGASFVIAFDIDKWAVGNAKENVERNKVSDRIELRQGTIDVIGENGFDVILANINRSVLLDYSQIFSSKLSHDGALLLSGILEKDCSSIISRYREVGLSVNGELHEGEWCCLAFSRAGTINITSRPTASN